MIPIDEDDDSTEKDQEDSEDEDSIEKAEDYEGAGSKKFLSNKPSTKTVRRGTNTATPVRIQRSTTSTDELPGSTGGANTG